MNTFLIAMLNGWEIVMILIVVLVLFGAKKLPELAKGLGQGIKEFKKASREVTEEFHRSMEEEQAAAARKSAAPPAPAPVATTAQSPVADSASTPKAS